jgi:hypothetical protein
MPSARNVRLARSVTALSAVILGGVLAGCGGGAHQPTKDGATTSSAASTPAPSTSASIPPPIPGSHTVGASLTLSGACTDPQAGNAEVTQAVDATRGYVYESWISCDGAAFARSVDGGKHFGAPVTLPGSTPSGTVHLSDGPAIAVAPDGAVYVTFALIDGRFPNPTRMYPVVDVSFDHGSSFPQKRLLTPPGDHNFADRPYIAVDAHGTAYVTWDYSPRVSSLVLAADASGSGYFKAGNLNLVVQSSTDQGRSWGPIRYVAKGSDVGKIIAEPGGRLDILYEGHHLSADGLYTLSPGEEYFTSSTDGGRDWSAPVQVGPQAGSVALDAWWIDSALGVDSAGNLYASWDTQVSGRDESWLAHSTDGGRNWSAPVRVTADTPKSAHILDLAGGWPGVVYVAWLTGGYGHPYAEYLRPYSVAHGWLSAPIQVSRVNGTPSTWPGDTIGVSVLPGQTAGADAATGQRVLLSWGSAPQTVAGSTSRIYFSTVYFAKAVG